MSGYFSNEELIAVLNLTQRKEPLAFRFFIFHSLTQFNLTRSLFIHQVYSQKIHKQQFVHSSVLKRDSFALYVSMH